MSADGFGCGAQLVAAAKPLDQRCGVDGDIADPAQLDRSGGAAQIGRLGQRGAGGQRQRGRRQQRITTTELIYSSITQGGQVLASQALAPLG